MSAQITDSKLSPHFSLFELTFTTRGDLQEANRTFITAEEIRSLAALCTNILEPVRAMFRVPLIIHSGFRYQMLNERVGGSDTSQHRKGEAADFHIRGLDDASGIKHAFDRIRRSTIPFGQLIDEFDSRRRWLHISLGVPYRSPISCGLALTMRINTEGKKEYVHVID